MSTLSTQLNKWLNETHESIERLKRDEFSANFAEMVANRDHALRRLLDPIPASATDTDRALVEALLNAINEERTLLQAQQGRLKQSLGQMKNSKAALKAYGDNPYK